MENRIYPMPLIGDKAPAFEAESTQGKIRFPKDFKGKWVIFFSHPSDFTPICTTEFVLFGAMQEEFEALNCKLLGLSVGTNASHIAWMRSIHDRIEYKGHRHVALRFPLIADMSMEVARMYGMIQPSASTTAAVRTVFFIDPAATIRAVISYPMQLGRNFDELKRILVGLQTIDRHHVALPADWRPGDDIVVPAPVTYDGTDASAEGMTCCDWYFCTRPLAETKVSPVEGAPKHADERHATAGKERSEADAPAKEACTAKMR
jgi:peroxiredoxin (alkyl hydroperoxide reductase subunit C)